MPSITKAEKAEAGNASPSIAGLIDETEAKSAEINPRALPSSTESLLPP